MIKELVKLANELDSLGLRDEADRLDYIIRRAGAEGYTGPIIKPRDLVKGERYDLVHPNGIAKMKAEFMHEGRHEGKDALFWRLLQHPDVTWPAVYSGVGPTGYQHRWNMRLVNLIIAPPGAVPDDKPDRVRARIVKKLPGPDSMGPTPRGGWRPYISLAMSIENSDNVWVEAFDGPDQIQELIDKARAANFIIDRSDVEKAIENGDVIR